MHMADLGQYLSRALLGADKFGLPGPDMVRDLLFTVATFVVGWLMSLGNSKKRIRNRVIDELLMAQRELKAWAYPKVWRQADPREGRMLEPFVARLRFLHSSVAEGGALSAKQLALLDAYVLRVQEFILKWEQTRNRTESYHYVYRVTYNHMRGLVKDLGLQQMTRLSELAPPRDELLDPLSLPVPQSAKPSSLSAVPAE